MKPFESRELMKKICLAVFIYLSLLTSCKNTDIERHSASDVPELEVATLTARDISIPLGYVSEIHAVQFVEIHARVQGYLEEIFVDEGQVVKKGQPLFRISSHEYEQMIVKAEAALQRAIAQAKTKSLDVDRMTLMVDKQIVSPTELEVAKANLQAAKSEIEEARSLLQNARTNLSYTLIRAPFDGIIDRIPFKIGSLINDGTLLTSISNIDEVFAYFRVSETEYLELLKTELNGGDFRKHPIRVGLQLADGSMYQHEGNIETMEGDFDRETGTIGFRARFPNPKRLLKHGSSGKIVMQRRLEDAILVPQQATFAIQNKNYVFVLDSKNLAKARSFNAVDKYEDYFIATDLSQGERIILEGIQQLRNGVPIKPIHIAIDSAYLTFR